MPPIVGKDKIKEMFIEQLKNRTELMFEGGGVKGDAYLGMLKRLGEYGVKLQQFDRVTGTSVGAIAAMFVAFNISIEEFETEMQDVDFSEFLNESESFVTKARTFWWTHGLNSPEPLYNWIKYLGIKFSLDEGRKTEFAKLFAIKLGKEKEGSDKPLTYANFKLFMKTIKPAEIEKFTNMTFAEFSQAKNPDGAKRFKELQVIVTQVNPLGPKVFNSLLTPNAQFLKVVGASATMPFVFSTFLAKVTPLEEKRNQNGDLEETSGGEFTENPNGQAFTDGGVTANNPLDLLGWIDKEGELLTGEALKEHQANLAHNALCGIFVNDNRPTTSVKFRKEDIGAPNSLKDLVTGVLTSFSKSNAQLPKFAENCAIPILVPEGVVSIDFQKANGMKAKLQEAGQHAVDTFIHQRVKAIKAEEEAIQTRKTKLRAWFEHVKARLGVGKFHYKRERGEDKSIFSDGFQLKFKDGTISLDTAERLLEEAQDISTFKVKVFSSPNNNVVFDADIEPGTLPNVSSCCDLAENTEVLLSRHNSKDTLNSQDSVIDDDLTTQNFPPTLSIS